MLKKIIALFSRPAPKKTVHAAPAGVLLSTGITL